MNGHKNEFSSFEKRLRSSEATFDKEKALLEQKVKLLKIEL